MLNESHVQNMMKSIAEGYADSYTKMFPLKSLWISEHRRAYRVGDKVIIEGGKLINSQGQPCTHEITLLEGTLADNKHSITLVDINTHEPLKIDL